MLQLRKILIIVLAGIWCSSCSVLSPERLQGKYAYSILGAKTASFEFKNDGTVYAGTFATPDKKGTYTLIDGKVEVTFTSSGAGNSSTITQTMTYNKSSDSLADSSGNTFARER